MLQHQHKFDRRNSQDINPTVDGDETRLEGKLDGGDLDDQLVSRGEATDVTVGSGEGDAEKGENRTLGGNDVSGAVRHGEGTDGQREQMSTHGARSDDQYDTLNSDTPDAI